MKVRISEFGWKAGFRLCRKRPDLWKITSKRGQSGAKTKFLGSVLPNGSDLWKHNLLACLLTVLAVNLVSCGEKEEKKIMKKIAGEVEYIEDFARRLDTGSRRTDSRHAVRSRHLL